MIETTISIIDGSFNIRKNEDGGIFSGINKVVKNVLLGHGA
jgi:hypothetical protein